MPWLPLLVSLAVAAFVVPTTVRQLRDQGCVRKNFRGATVAFPAGAAVIAAALLALVPLAIARELGADGVFQPAFGQALTYVIGVALLGLLDDLMGGVARAQRAGAPRGWRGHARVSAGGRLSSGALKAAGSLGLALFVLGGQGLDAGAYLVAVAVLALSTNLFNLLDLRPGRSVKALLLLGAGLTIGSLDPDPLWVLGIFLAPLVVLLPLDLRERGMLGDTGSNAVGAVAGLWLVLSLPTTGQAVALALIALATVYGEFRSISALIDRTPGLRQIDSLGRASHA